MYRITFEDTDTGATYAYDVGERRWRIVETKMKKEEELAEYDGDDFLVREPSVDLGGDRRPETVAAAMNVGDCQLEQDPCLAEAGTVVQFTVRRQSIPRWLE